MAGLSCIGINPPIRGSIEEVLEKEQERFIRSQSPYKGFNRDKITVCGNCVSLNPPIRGSIGLRMKAKEK